MLSFSSLTISSSLPFPTDVSFICLVFTFFLFFFSTFHILFSPIQPVCKPETAGYDSWPLTPANDIATAPCEVYGRSGYKYRPCSKEGYWGEGLYQCDDEYNCAVSPNAVSANGISLLSEWPKTGAGRNVTLACPPPYVGWVTRNCISERGWNWTKWLDVQGDCVLGGNPLWSTVQVSVAE